MTDTSTSDEVHPQIVAVHKIAANFQKHFERLQATLALLPKSYTSDSAKHYMDTAALWTQQALTEQEARVRKHIADED
jgi:hypothetical protein